MTASDPGISAASRLIDAAFLVSEDGSEFSEVCESPAWYLECFGSVERPGEHSPFLADFLDRVQSSGDAKVKSGLWEENSRFFEASVSRDDGQFLLMIESADERHRYQQQILHSNHVHELNRQRLRKELELKKILLECVMHDLANPSAVLLMNLQHIERNIGEGERENLKPAMDRAIGQVNRQRQLIQSIGDVFGAEIDHAAVMAESEAPDLVTLLGETIREQEFASGRSHNVFEMEGPAQAKVRADRIYLRRIFENIYNNAVRHSPEGGQIQAFVEKSGNFIRTEIRDEGCGFCIDTDKVFEPFSQGESNSGSSGLGLYFCRMAVEMFGGSIRAENRKEGGAKVIVILPAII